MTCYKKIINDPSDAWIYGLHLIPKGPTFDCYKYLNRKFSFGEFSGNLTNKILLRSSQVQIAFVTRSQLNSISPKQSIPLKMSKRISQINYWTLFLGQCTAFPSQGTTQLPEESCLIWCRHSVIQSPGLEGGKVVVVFWCDCHLLSTCRKSRCGLLSPVVFWAFLACRGANVSLMNEYVITIKDR